VSIKVCVAINTIAAMPLACAQNHQPESLLRHFAEVMINQLLDASVKELPGVFRNKVIKFKRWVFI
jgi:hypothetical protein